MKGQTIMHDKTTIVSIILERQASMRREINRRGIAMKAIAMDSGIKYDTLLTYFPGDTDNRVPAQIPGSAIFALTGVLPADIMSLLLPSGHLIVRAPEAMDHDDVSEAVRDYLDAKEKAHHPESEEGREIGPNEDNVLCGKFAVVVGGKAAA